MERVKLLSPAGGSEDQLCGQCSHVSPPAQLRTVRRLLFHPSMRVDESDGLLADTVISRELVSEFFFFNGHIDCLIRCREGFSGTN